MGKYRWIEQLNIKEYIMPYVIEKDQDYQKSLDDKLSAFCDDVRIAGADEQIISVVSDLKSDIISAMESYYRGEIWEAHVTIDEIIKQLENIPTAVSNINDTYPLWGNGSNVQLFRARLGNNMIDYPAEEMLHVPFNLRGKIRTERFSIPGLPCLYLGNTSYSCWIEMGSPEDYKFNVSPVIIEKEMKVLNLAVSIRHLIEWNDSINEEDCTDEELETRIKLLMLTMATSFHIKQDERAFKSEYVIPQMIMSACIAHGIDGVVYISKKVSEEIFGMSVAVNVALLAKYEGEEKFSEICKHIKTSDSYNFAMFNRILMPSLKYRNPEMTTMNSPLIKSIGSYSRQIPYNETTFWEFDKFLFSSVEMKKIKID